HNRSKSAHAGKSANWQRAPREWHRAKSSSPGKGSATSSARPSGRPSETAATPHARRARSNVRVNRIDTLQVRAPIAGKIHTSKRKAHDHEHSQMREVRRQDLSFAARAPSGARTQARA